MMQRIKIAAQCSSLRLQGVPVVLRKSGNLSSLVIYAYGNSEVFYKSCRREAFTVNQLLLRIFILICLVRKKFFFS